MFYPLNYGDQRRRTLPARQRSSKPEIRWHHRNLATMRAPLEGAEPQMYVVPASAGRRVPRSPHP